MGNGKKHYEMMQHYLVAEKIRKEVIKNGKIIRMAKRGTKTPNK